MSIKPKSARVWWVLTGIFAVLGALFALASWGLYRQTHRLASDACAEQGGSWDVVQKLCIHNR